MKARFGSRVAAEVKPDNVVAATTGGLAAANAVIEELARLHAVGSASVQVLEVPDGTFRGQPDRAVPEKFHPAAGFRARWQALSLIERGNLLAAWGAVSHLENEPGQEWTKIIDWLRRFASSRPLPDNCDISVLKHPRMAVCAALRVELALRAGDIPRAVHGTVAFFEAALWDHLNERFERSPDREKRRFFKLKKGDAPSGAKLLRKGDGSDEDRTRPFELKETVDGVDWYWIYDDDAPAGRIAKYYLKLEGLQKLSKALSGDIRELRNDVAHNEPTPELMDDACRRMTEAGLWSSDGRFLTQEIIRGVLMELGESEPESMCAKLIATVRSRLLGHRPDGASPT